MSNFNCDICGLPIIENERGEYVTSCKHYPMEGLQLHNAVFAESKERADMPSVLEVIEDFISMTLTDRIANKIEQLEAIWETLEDEGVREYVRDLIDAFTDILECSSVVLEEVYE